jgi:hypothetical protein
MRHKFSESDKIRSRQTIFDVGNSQTCIPPIANGTWNRSGASAHLISIGFRIYRPPWQRRSRQSVYPSTFHHPQRSLPRLAIRDFLPTTQPFGLSALPVARRPSLLDRLFYPMMHRPAAPPTLILVPLRQHTRLREKEGLSISRNRDLCGGNQTPRLWTCSLGLLERPFNLIRLLLMHTNFAMPQRSAIHRHPSL